MVKNFHIVLLSLACLVVLHSVNAESEQAGSEIPVGAMERAPKDLPSSVTVITRSEIEILGFTGIEDVLRLIPGMSVSETATSRQNISYHGTNSILPRRTMVLVDGMSIHRVGNSTIYWHTFPVSVDDIERIEIYRNHVYPKSGSKTLQATINIITRHPADVTQSTISAINDTLGFARQSVSVKSQVSDTNFYVRFENTANPGFDTSTMTSAAGIEKTVTPLDGMNDKKLTLRSSTPMGDAATLNIMAGVLDGDIDIDTRDAGATGEREEGFENQYLNATLDYSTEVDNVKFGAYINSIDRTKEWHTCYPLFLFTDELRALSDKNPAYANTLIGGKIPSGGTAEDNALAKAVLAKVATLGPLAKSKECGFINENFSDARRVFNIEHSHLFTDNFLLTSGYEFQNNYFESQTLADGVISYVSHNLHTTAHLQATDNVGISTGGNYYSVNMRDKNDGKFSYHAGINYDYFPNQTAKLVLSKTHRSPDPLEQYPRWSYFMTNFSTPFDGKTEGYFYRTTMNIGEPVTAENYKTYELDFSGYLFTKHMEYDIKLFKEKMDNLISQDLIFTKFAPTNDSFTTLKGIEFMVKYHFNESYQLIAGGSDITNDSTNINEESLSLKNSGYISFLYNGNQNTASLSYFGSNGIYENSFDRIELNVRHNVNFFGSAAYIQGRLRHQPGDYIASQGQINASGTGRDGSFATMEYTEKTSLTIGVGVTF